MNKFQETEESINKFAWKEMIHLMDGGENKLEDFLDENRNQEIRVRRSKKTFNYLRKMSSEKEIDEQRLLKEQSFSKTLCETFIVLNSEFVDRSADIHAFLAILQLL